jgi:hypothetical protein
VMEGAPGPDPAAEEKDGDGGAPPLHAEVGSGASGGEAGAPPALGDGARSNAEGRSNAASALEVGAPDCVRQRGQSPSGRGECFSPQAGQVSQSIVRSLAAAMRGGELRAGRG